MENIIFLSFTLLFLILVSVHVYMTNAFFRRLQENHSEVWESLGQPRWKIHFGDDSFQNAMKYIRQKKFTDLNDPVLEGYFKKMKRVEYAALAFAIAIIAITLADIS